MFSKPISLILVYILTIINFLILLIPFIFAISPLVIIDKQEFILGIINICYGSLFIMSSVMIIYLILDSLFGFSIWTLTKGCKRPSKYYKELPFMEEIEANFKTLKKQFGAGSAKLYISSSSDVNAYAIGSMRKKIVVITIGIIAHIRELAASEEEFQDSVKAIMAHEVSHLVNKDFLPTLLLFASDKAVSIVSGFITILFNFLSNVVYYIPVIGFILHAIIHMVYNIANFLLTFFNRYIIHNIYEFMKLSLSRSTEYRCDRQGAFACGGDKMAVALSFLGEGGYFTLFSTHPRTSKRMKKVINIQKKESKIHISIINRLSNFLSIMILVILLSFSYDHVSKIDYPFLKENYFGLKAREYKAKINDKLSPIIYPIKNLIQQHVR